MKQVLCLLLSLLFLTTACNSRYGFLESELKLSAESRLPKFVPPNNNIKPSDELVQIRIYSGPSGGKARIIVVSKSNPKTVLYDKAGTFRWHPVTEEAFKKSGTHDIYPQYFTVNIDNVEESFEKKSKGDVVYVVDAPLAPSK